MHTKVFVIAEAGINHKGDPQLAKELVYAAKQSGADAVKFQTYTTEKRTSVSKDNVVWKILKDCEMTYEQQARVKEYADEVGIEFFSTPFDTDALDFLVEDLKVRRIKIASFDSINHKFLNAVNAYGNKFDNYNVIMSTGMSSFSEIDGAIKCLKDVSNLTILHCKSAYPLKEEDANLSAISSLKYGFGSGYRKFGYSDHTTGIEVPALSVLAGAEVVEKHFTLDNNNGAADNPVSLDPRNFTEMVKLIRRYEIIMGAGELKMHDCEQGTKIFRRHS